MNTQSPKNPAGVIFPAVICALLCVFFYQSGLFFLFSLVSIGVAGLLFSPLTCWFAVSYSIIIYAGSLIVFHIRDSIDFFGFLLQTGIFSLFPLLFAWIIAPPLKGPSFLRMRAAFRLVMSSIIILAVYIPIVYNLFQQEDFYQSFLAYVENILSMMSLVNVGGDAVEQSLMRNYFTAENMVSTVVFFGLRGGGLVSMLFFFFLNRQLSISLTKIFRKTNFVPGLALFKIKSSFIWVLSFSILMLLVSFLVKLDILEIIAWNIFVLCVIIYAAQGMGIVLFLLNRPRVARRLKIVLNLLFILMIFRFSVMIFFLVAMTILGILEHWLPLRASKLNRPPSTPKV